MGVRRSKLEGGSERICLRSPVERIKISSQSASCNLPSSKWLNGRCQVCWLTLFLSPRSFLQTWPTLLFDLCFDHPRPWSTWKLLDLCRLTCRLVLKLLR